MARINNLSNFLTDVASAIKTKKGSEASIPAANFDIEILALPSQGVYEQRALNISANGSQTITPSAGYDAIDELVLTIAVPEKQLQAKSYEFTDNTTITLLPETGYDGFTSVGLTINVPGATINNQNKTITQNGSYTADQGYTGIGTATVNVPIANTSEYNSDLSLSQQILGSSALPYIPLEYIENTSDSYIDTGKILTQNNSMEFKIMSPDSIITGTSMICGSRSGASSNNIGSNYQANNLAVDFNNSNYGTYRAVYANMQTETEYILYCSKNTRKIYDKNRNILVENNNVCGDTITTPSTCTIFMTKPQPQPTWVYGKIKIYYFKIWENNELIADFIPVKRKSDNEICMYDKVTNTFFTNAGTGSFVAGPVIN